MFEVTVVFVLNLDHTPRVLSSAHILCANLYNIHYSGVNECCTSVHNIAYTVTYILYTVTYIVYKNLTRRPKVLSSAHILCVNLYNIHYLGVNVHTVQVYIAQYNVTYNVYTVTFIVYKNL